MANTLRDLLIRSLKGNKGSASMASKNKTQKAPKKAKDANDYTWGCGPLGGMPEYKTPKSEPNPFIGMGICGSWRH